MLRYQMEFRMGADGWSEVIYNAGDNAKSAQGTMQALIDQRVKCLVNTALVHHARISLVGGATPSFRFIPTGNVGAVISKRDVGPVCTNVGVYSTLGYRRTLQLHGLPDSDHRFSDTGVANTDLSGAVQTYLQYLRDNQFCIRTVAQRAAAHLGAVISAITLAGGVMTVTVPTAGFSIGQKVRISGATGQKSRQWNAVFKIGTLVAGPPTQFTATTRRLLDPTASYDPGSAQLRSADLNGFTYPTINSFDTYTTNGTRRTGRPTDSPHGKQALKR